MSNPENFQNDATDEFDNIGKDEAMSDELVQHYQTLRPRADDGHWHGGSKKNRFQLHWRTVLAKIVELEIDQRLKFSDLVRHYCNLPGYLANAQRVETEVGKAVNSLIETDKVRKVFTDRGYVLEVLDASVLDSQKGGVSQIDAVFDVDSLNSLLKQKEVKYEKPSESTEESKINLDEF